MTDDTRVIEFWPKHGEPITQKVGDRVRYAEWPAGMYEAVVTAVDVSPDGDRAAITLTLVHDDYTPD